MSFFKQSFIVFVIILSLCVAGCERYVDIVPNIAGDNKSELVKVLNHYKSDSVKFKAAKFLIENMQWHYSQEEDKSYPDAVIIDYDFLVSHIDHAFYQWKNSPYARGLSFDDFAEYLLPYRASQGFGCNITAPDRKQWLSEHIGLPDSIHSLEGWIQHYNRSIRKLRIDGGKTGASYRSGLNDLLHEDFTDCADKAMQACLNLRAIGIPCVVEHNLGYRTLKAHHYHCAVWDSENQKWIKFDAEGIKDYPGEGDWTSAELLNIYRETYAPQSDAPYVEGKKMPRGFSSPCQKDVTHHTVKIEVPLDSFPIECTPYLASFHRSATGLQPFTHGYVKNGKAVFEHVVPTVWYVVTIYPDGKQSIISRPFWVNEMEDGTSYISYADFEGDNQQTENITLTRKYPVKDRLVKRAMTLIGTTIEGANRPDFADSQILWRLDSMPQPKVVNYPFKKRGNYRYYRLNTPKACEVSVLEWLTENGAIPITDKTNQAYDGDMTTAPTDSTSITLSLTDPQRVIGIKLAPINADNAITPGHNYQLYTWSDDKGWLLHSTLRAYSEYVTFRNVQKESLLWLKDISKGQEEMPFLHKKGQSKFIY